MDGFAHWLGIEVTASGDGRAEVRLDADERHLDPAGTVHGGTLAGLVDTAMGLAVRSPVSGPDAPATSQPSLAFLRPGQRGAALNQLRRTGFDVRDDDVQRLSPLGHEHINLLGRFQFSTTDLGSGQLQPLREPTTPEADRCALDA